MSTYYIGSAGNDSNSGLSEAAAWKTLATSSRLKPGDILIALPGTLTGTFQPPSGTSAAPITFKAKAPLETTVDGSRRVDGLGWTRIAKGFQTPHAALVFNVFQRTFETDGKQANFNNRDFNQYDSNPQLDLHGTPAEFKWANGFLRLNAIPSTPSAEPLYAAITEVALNLNGKSHVNVEGIITRGHKHAVATNGGTGIHLSGCRFTFCGSTAVWLVGLADASMQGCVIEGAGSWEGHYEDCLHTERVGTLRIIDTEMSYGGHSGLIMLTGVPGSKITLTRVYWHHMGGSLLTLKRSVDGLLVEDCWFADAAKSTAVDAHKVPHAGIQLSGKGHTFRNCVFVNNGKDVLASSDGNADSNPVCSDNTFDRCTFSNSEAGAVEGQEYAPAGRLERNTWKDCIIKGDVALFYAGAGSRANTITHSQIVGQVRGVVVDGCSANPIPNTGSTLTKPPTAPVTPPIPPEPPMPTRPTLTRLFPAGGAGGTVVRAEGTSLTDEILVPVPDGARRLTGVPGTDTVRNITMPADVVTGEVRARNGSLLSNPLVFTRTSTPPPTNQPPVANAGGPYSGTVGEVMRFDGLGSSDPDGTIARYLWTIGASITKEGAKVTHTFDVAGTVTVTLTVTDDKGATNTATTTATIAAAPPPTQMTVAFTVTPYPNGATFGGTVAAGGPLPEGSTITVTARKPDGATATATVTVAATQPPSDLPAEVTEVIRLHNETRAAGGLQALTARTIVAEEGEIDEPWIWTSPRASLVAAAVAGPLTAHPQLTTAARLFAEEMQRTGVFSHTGEGGSTPFTRMAAAGYRGSTMGENIAKGFSNAQSVMLAWMNSPGHRANILNPAYRDIGCWFVAASGIWVVDFGG